MKLTRTCICAASFLLASPMSGAAEPGREAAVLVRLNIPAQPVRDALEQFAQLTGLQIVVYSEVAHGQMSRPISGEFSPEVAIARILADTGLRPEYLDSRTIAVVRADRQAIGVQRTGAQSSREVPLRLAQAESSVSSAINPAAAPIGAQMGLEEIVVTAQKRSERLIDVPVSMSVLTAEDLQQRGLVSRADYMRSVPGVLLREDGVGLAEIVIRGAYADRFNSGPTVGLYFGDVPLTGYALGGSTDIKLIDIERVEVLRGPQGSLHGSNALSGAIRYIPAPPNLDAFSGQVSADYSHTSGTGGNNTALSGVLNVPLIEGELAIRAVAFGQHTDGYIKNTAGSDATVQAAAAQYGASALAINKEHAGDSDHAGGRISILWKPVDAVELGLTYFTQTDAQADRLFELSDAGRYRRADFQFGPQVGGNDDALRLDVDIVNLTAEYDFGWGSVYSSTAWLEQRFIRKWDIGSLLSAPAMPAPQINTTNADVFTQEVRVTSQWDGPFRLVAGVYYEDSETPSAQATYFAGDPALSPFASALLWQTALDRQVQQQAAFGELTYRLNEQLELTVGGRAFEYDTRFWTTFYNSVVIPNSTTDAETSESGYTGKAGLKYQPSDNATLYASWSEGFRLGQPLATELLRTLCDTDSDGFLDGSAVRSTLDRIDSDRLDSYELGGKFNLMQGRASVSAAIYHNEWTDVPVVFTAPGCLQTTTINGGSAQARGIEAEGSFRLLEDWRVNFGFGYVDSELTSTTSLGADGDRMNFTPEFNGNFGIEYSFALFQKEAFVRGDYTYFGSYFTETGERGIRADAYSIVNLRAGLNAFEGGELLFHIDNLTNEDALVAVTGPGGFPPNYGLRLQPRTVGVGLSYRF